MESKYYELLKNTRCEDCCCDCSNCPHKDNFDSIAESLDLFDYILNHSCDT